MKQNISIHPDFKLNGHSFSENDLHEMAISLIKDGEPHEKDLGDLMLQWFDDREYITLKTSGTTGAPKEIKLQKEAMVASALATGEFFNLQPRDKALLCLPARYIAGKMMFIRAIVLGLELDFVNPSSHPLQNKEKIYDFVAMVPLQVQQSLDQLHKVKVLIVGGAQLNDALKEQLKPLPCKVYETYGMTETITHIAAKKIEEPYFSALPHAHLSKDNRGCLVINAPLVNKETIVTNDLVEMINDTQFQWLGRFDNVINSGGVKLIPEIIEQKLSEYIPYRFYVIGKDDELLGKKLVLVIEHSTYDLVPEIFENLEKFERPKEVLFVEHFKETPTGKILRKETIEL